MGKHGMGGGSQDHRRHGEPWLFLSPVWDALIPQRLHPGQPAQGHISTWWYDSSKSSFLPLKTTLDGHLNTMCSKFLLKVLEGVLFFLFFLPQMCTGPGECEPWGQVVHHIRFGADSSRYHCPTHLADVQISPSCSQVLWSVSGEARHLLPTVPFIPFIIFQF